AIEATGFANSSVKTEPETRRPDNQVAASTRVNNVKASSVEKAVEDVQQKEQNAAQQEREKQSAQEMSALVDKVNDSSLLRQRNLELSVNTDIGRTIVKVIDSESGDLIRQIPSENLVKIASLLKESNQNSSWQAESALGLLIDSRI
ncbi:hypothetical protein C9975_03535, partial [Thalassospira xiamenensis]